MLRKVRLLVVLNEWVNYHWLRYCASLPRGHTVNSEVWISNRKVWHPHWLCFTPEVPVITTPTKLGVKVTQILVYFWIYPWYLLSLFTWYILFQLNQGIVAVTEADLYAGVNLGAFSFCILSGLWRWNFSSTVSSYSHAPHLLRHCMCRLRAVTTFCVCNLKIWCLCVQLASFNNLKIPLKMEPVAHVTSWDYQSKLGD